MTNRRNPFLKYSSLAFEMLATIGVGALAGHFIDQKMANTTPYATAGLALLFVGIALYRVLRDVAADQSKPE